MNSEADTKTAKGAKAPVQNLAYGLFGRRVSDKSEPAPKSQLVDEAA